MSAARLETLWVIMSEQLGSCIHTLRLWATSEAAVMRWMAYRRLVSCPMRVSSAAASSDRSVSSSSACYTSHKLMLHNRSPFDCTKSRQI